MTSFREQDIAFELADERLLAEREPALHASGYRALFLPGMAQVRNPRHIKALLAWCGHYQVPRPDGRVLVGSTEEDAGFS